MRSSKYLTVVTCVILLLSACSRTTTLDGLFDAPTAYEKYKKSLEQAKLDQTALGKDWLEAGKISLHDSLIVELPYRETGYFAPDKPSALCLRYPVQEGQNIYIKIEPLSQPNATYFLDVFEVTLDSSLQQIHAADSLMTLTYEVEKSGWHAVRIQPELLRGGPFLLDLGFQASMSFPVLGKNSKAIASFFGAPRDGGKRSHKGIDIFAPKGTPVLAASGGVVGRVTNNRLGGKVVWLSSLKKGVTQYYAHLDSQAVRPGQRVAAGDTIGFVGNTGNARFTPPHLHFSIYKFGKGAVDPFPFVHQLLEEAPLEEVDSAQIGIPARIKAQIANIRRAPTTKSDIVISYPLHTLVSINGKSGTWYRITLPDMQKGYIHDSLIESIEQPINQVTLTEEDHVYTTLPQEQEAMSGALAAGPSTVLAEFDSLWYIQTSRGYHAWTSKVQ